jgi:hypothetical protein
MSLDGRDASPQVENMEQDDKGKNGPRESRDAKLAQALRANLRRRKAVAPQPAPKPHKSTTD